MQAQFRLTEADYVSAGWVHLMHHPVRSLLQYKHPLGFAIVATIVVVQFPDRWEDAGLVFAIAAGLFGYLSFAHRWSWRQYFSKAGLGNRVISVVIDNESIRWHGGTRETIRRWDELSDIDENRRLFVFRGMNGRLMVVPKPVLSELQIQELRMLISSCAKCRVRVAHASA